MAIHEGVSWEALGLMKNILRVAELLSVPSAALFVSHYCAVRANVAPSASTLEAFWGTLTIVSGMCSLILFAFAVAQFIDRRVCGED